MANRLQFDLPWFVPPKASTDFWRLEHDWTLVFRGEYYHIPAGTPTDGASIPRWLWWLCGTPFDCPRLYAAVVHDWLYSGGDSDATRADADDLYRDIQIELGVSRVRAYVEWIALRLFGRSHWQK